MRHVSLPSLFYSLLVLLVSLSRPAFSQSTDVCAQLFLAEAGPISLQKRSFYPIRVQMAGDMKYEAYAKAYFLSDQTHPPVVSYRSFGDKQLAAEIEILLNQVYKIYGNRQTVPKDWIAAMRELDGSLPLTNLNYIFFVDPRTEEAKVVIRIFDGSPKVWLGESRAAQKLPLEIEYPHLVLPDRSQGNQNLIELGRMGKADEVDGDLNILLESVSTYVRQFHELDLAQSAAETAKNDPIIYVEASAVAARMYRQKYGFEIVFGPKEVGVLDTYILRMNAKSFMQKHHMTNVPRFTLTPAIRTSPEP